MVKGHHLGQPLKYKRHCGGFLKAKTVNVLILLIDCKRPSCFACVVLRLDCSLRYLLLIAFV